MLARSNLAKGHFLADLPRLNDNHAETDNLDAVRIVTRDVIRDFAEDGVRYLELRTTPREVEGRMSRQQYCETVLEEMISVSSTGLGITVKLLLSIDRKNLDGMDDIVR